MVTTYLVILLTWVGVADPWTPASVQSQFDTVRAFYQAESDQQQTVDSVVTPWLVSASPAPTTCDLDAYAAQAEAAATAAGYDLTAYNNHFAYMLPPSATMACAYSMPLGTGPLHQGRVWLRTNLASVAVHEIGHNFGLMHSWDLDCGKYVNGNNGTTCHMNGDWLDVMGALQDQNGVNTIGELSGYHRTLLGWANPITVPVGTSTTYLLPVESALRVILRVPWSPDWDVLGSGYAYWLEWRQPLGFDAYLSGKTYAAQTKGVTIWQINEHQASQDGQYLLDLTPGTASWQDAALAYGKSYVDTLHGITIHVGSVVNGQVSVTVTR